MFHEESQRKIKSHWIRSPFILEARSYPQESLNNIPEITITLVFLVHNWWRCFKTLWLITMEIYWRSFQKHLKNLKWFKLWGIMRYLPCTQRNWENLCGRRCVLTLSRILWVHVSPTDRTHGVLIFGVWQKYLREYNVRRTRKEILSFLAFACFINLQQGEHQADLNLACHCCAVPRCLTLISVICKPFQGSVFKVKVSGSRMHHIKLCNYTNKIRHCN